MAIKPVIYKLTLTLSDLNRHYYNNHQLTIALHPSETTERMMVRILAFCLNASEALNFTKGLSEADEPALWARSLDNQLIQWIDVGEPTPERIKKAATIAQEVLVYSFNTKSDVWWSQNAEKFLRLKARYFRFGWEQIAALTTMADRTMQFQVTISENSLYVNSQTGDCEITFEQLG